MGSRGVTTTRTRALVKKSVRKALDSTDTLQAQVVRMRYGIAEEPDCTEVGQPVAGLDENTRQRLLQIEEKILEKARSVARRRVHEKIVRALRKK